MSDPTLAQLTDLVAGGPAYKDTPEQCKENRKPRSRKKSSAGKHISCDNLYTRSSGRWTWRELSLRARFNTWEPESNILDQRLVDEFEDRCRNSGDLFIKDDVLSDETADSPKQLLRRGPLKNPLTKEQARDRQKKKRAAMTTDEIEAEREKARDRMRQFRERQKNGSEEGEDGTTTSKRKRPSRTCAVPSGFWDPVVIRTADSGIDSHSEEDDADQEILRAKRKMKNFEPAPSNYDSCYTDEPVESSNGCINDLGESVFPKKKFSLKPPTLDLSKKPLSDFVFKIDDLWADKVHEASVKALGYRVKIYECKSSKTLFTKKPDKLTPDDSNQRELDT